MIEREGEGEEGREGGREMSARDLCLCLGASSARLSPI